MRIKPQAQGQVWMLVQAVNDEGYQLPTGNYTVGIKGKDSRGRTTKTIRTVRFPHIEPGAILDLKWTRSVDRLPQVELVMLDDHINLLGSNPLIGPNLDALGPRFPDMSEPYDRELQGLAAEAAMAKGITLNRGVYVAWTGPAWASRRRKRNSGCTPTWSPKSSARA